MEIRKAKKHDSSRIIDLLVQVGNIHAMLRPDLFIINQTKYNEKELDEIISNEQTPIFVYINDQNILVGYAFCIIQESTGNNLVFHKGLYIDDICVDENFRKHHVASDLYHYIVDYAKNIGCYHLTLNVWKDNYPAKTFYEKCGFKEQKTVMEKII